MEQKRIKTEFFLPQGKSLSKFYDLEAPVVFAGTNITPPALKRPRRDTVDSSPPPARNVAPGNPGTSSELACIMDAPLSQSMDSVNTVATGEDEVRYPLSLYTYNNSFFLMNVCVCVSQSPVTLPFFNPFCVFLSFLPRMRAPSPYFAIGPCASLPVCLYLPSFLMPSACLLLLLL